MSNRLNKEEVFDYLIHHKGTISELSEHFGVPKSQVKESINSIARKNSQVKKKKTKKGKIYFLETKRDLGNIHVLDRNKRDNKFTPRKYLITSAQACASPHSHFIEGLEHYCSNEDAELIILPMIGQSAREDLDQLNPVFRNFDVEYGERKLNSNIQIKQFNIRPYQIDPITGLSRFAQRETTLLFASPKQRLKPIAHSNNKYPKFLITTGACTRPNYATSMDVSAERRRLGNISTRDHIYGGIVIEIESDEKFHMRNLRANSRGKFVDFGTEYDGKEIAKSTLEALVLGDYHMGKTDEETRQVNFEMINPKRLVLHDFFDGHSVNHHMNKQFIEQNILQQLDFEHHKLEKEFTDCYNELIELSERMNGRKIYVVASNHHEFLNRYLNEGRFMDDVINARFGFKLAGHMAKKDYNNPVEEGIRMMGKLPKNIIFLRRDEDLKVRGYQLGSHGDKGPGGGRGSMTSKENDWGKSITGHVHKAQILRDTYTVGTCLPLNMFYMRGQPSDWSHTNAFLWDTGTVQMVNIIDGKYKI